jgi:Spy/CpxP family protein refolding chaperone
MMTRVARRFSLAPFAGALLSASFAFAPALTHAQSPSPYAGEERRAIKALSLSEIRQLEAGAGMGFAKAAELNSYPGPMHVLELASALRLSAEQEKAVKDLMDSHKAEVRLLGREVVRLERELDSLFATRAATKPAVEAKAQEIALAAAKVRASHLTTHIATAALLTPAQVERYDELRGYRR